jgi:serine/threonine protein kinase
MEASSNQALPVGYRLLDYEIRKVLSAGGFSFVYIARDKDKKLSPSKNICSSHWRCVLTAKRFR